MLMDVQHFSNLISISIISFFFLLFSLYKQRFLLASEPHFVEYQRIAREQFAGSYESGKDRLITKDNVGVILALNVNLFLYFHKTNKFVLVPSHE